VNLLGKLVSPKDIIQNNIRDYISLSTGPYSKLLQGTPTFVTYFRKNILASKEDPSLETVVEIVGSESPISYNKIDNFILYGIEQLSISIENGDFGVDTECQGEAVIIPQTIRPLPDDAFIIGGNLNQFIFKVTDVQSSLLSGEKFYKIQFELSSWSVDMIEEQVDGSYSLFMDDMGTGKVAILTSQNALLIDYARKIESKLIDHYVKNYFSMRYNIINYRINEWHIYNQYLTKFIIDNNILDKGKSFLSTICLIDIFEQTPFICENYEKTIYYAVETTDHSELSFENFKLFEIHDPLTPFYNSYDKHCIVNYDEDLITDINMGVFVPHENRLVSDVKENITTGNLIKDSIILYLNNSLEINNEFLDQLNNYNYFMALEEFLLLPCLIFALKKFIQNINKVSIQ
jgi:hypothetical protein